MLKAGFISLGCAKNLVDTEVMLGLLADSAIQIINDPQQADILIVNTCSFIDSAKEESISTILQMAEYKKQGQCRALIVAGCLGQRYHRDLLDEMPEVDVIIGTGAWNRILEAVDAALSGQRILLLGDNNTIYDETMPRVTTTPFYSAYVKIAEGCSNGCSYCVIPRIRGAFRSRPLESVVQEVQSLAAKGVREINLIAQDTTSYGRDLYGEPSLTELLRRLVQLDGIVWIRLLYCYPTYFSDDLIELMAREPKICRYIDLPLQHADDAVLRRMNRQDTRQQIEALLARLRRRIPGVVIRTSFIVGFPGETAAQFAALREFMLEQRFERVGIFTYSQEEGTAAAALVDQISETVKQERYHELMALQCQISEEINRSLEETPLEVLIEKVEQDGEQRIVAGRSYREAPNVDGTIFVECAETSRVGDLVRVKVVQGFTYDLLAEKQ